MESFKKGQRGQGTIEYVLLLAVVTFLLMSIINSDFFKKYFGQDGLLMTTTKGKIEYNYRNGNDGLTGSAGVVLDYTKPLNSYSESGAPRVQRIKEPYTGGF